MQKIMGIIIGVLIIIKISPTEEQKSRFDTGENYMVWVEACLQDFQTIEVGMVRSEIENKFPMDGGIQVASPVRFTHPECPYFKIDVSFDFKCDESDQGRAIWSSEDKVTYISKPYIERPVLD